MRFFLSLTAILAASPALAEWQQIGDRDTFRAEVVDNAYADANGSWFQFNSNGTLSGGADGKDLTGTWRYQNGMACFNRALGGEDLPADCIVVLVDGNALVTVRDQGRGKQTQYTKR